MVIWKNVDDITHYYYMTQTENANVLSLDRQIIEHSSTLTKVWLSICKKIN